MKPSQLRRPFLTTVRITIAAALLAHAVAIGPAAAAALDVLYDSHLDPAVGEACVEVGCGHWCQQALDRARRATAPFVDEEVALASGYVATPVCVAVPGVGGMGTHYVSSARLNDGRIDPRFPEVLLYEEMPNGDRELVGLEYFVPVLSGGAPWFGGADEPPPTVDNPPPVLFGRTLDGPVAGQGPGMPWHYEMHVWAWKHNPSGTFAPFNPLVACR